MTTIPDVWKPCVAKGTDVATLSCFPIIFQRFVLSALTLAGITAVTLILIAGIRMILAGGDAKKLDGARNTLTFAIIGLLVIFLAAFIINLLAYILGVPCVGILPGFSSCGA